MTSASIIRDIVIKNGRRVGTFSGVGVFSDNDNTFVLIPRYYWFDLFLLFPIYALYSVDNTIIAKVMEEKISRLDQK